MSEKVKQLICEICRDSHSTEEHLKTAELILKLNNENPEVVKEAETNGPGIQDIIRLNGRWAQTFAEEQNHSSIPIKYLDDGSNEFIDLTEYHLQTYYNSHVRMFRNLFSDTEFNHIHWESGASSDLNNNVTIFGEYVSNNSK